jgi:phage-related baseplate assembly protein
MAIDIRLLTGAPFTAVSQQVRSNISSLVNSNPVGQSIDISSIISTVRAVPGVISVAIDSPLYNSSNDLIQVAPSQKTRIIDASVDISVSQIGS